MSVTTAIILDKRRMNKKTKNYQVCIRVTFDRTPRVFPVGIELSLTDFNKLDSPRLGEKLREIKEKLDKEEQRAKTIIQNFNKFSFSLFSEQFNAFRPGQRRGQSKNVKEEKSTGSNNPGLPAIKRENFVNQFGKRKYPQKKSEMDFKALGEVAVFYGVYIEKLEAKEQIGTANIYVSSLMNLLEYRPQLRFSDVTDTWLYKYEKARLKDGITIGTIGMYLRCFRRIFNMVIAKKIIDRDLYPFGRDLYVIPAGRSRKKTFPCLISRLCSSIR